MVHIGGPVQGTQQTSDEELATSWRPYQCNISQGNWECGGGPHGSAGKAKILYHFRLPNPFSWIGFLVVQYYSRVLGS